MRILTIRQPYASAIVYGGKNVENRTRNIAGTYRGMVAIHAGVKKADVTRVPQWPLLKELWERNVGYPLRFGHIIGVIELVDVHTVEECWHDLGLCSDWALPGHLHLELRNPRPLAQTIPFKGALGLRRLDADTTRQIEEQLA